MTKSDQFMTIFWPVYDHILTSLWPNPAQCMTIFWSVCYLFWLVNHMFQPMYDHILTSLWPYSDRYLMVSHPILLFFVRNIFCWSGHTVSMLNIPHTLSETNKYCYIELYTKSFLFRENCWMGIFSRGLSKQLCCKGTVKTVSKVFHQTGTVLFFFQSIVAIHEN